MAAPFKQFSGILNKLHRIKPISNYKHKDLLHLNSTRLKSSSVAADLKVENSGNDSESSPRKFESVSKHVEKDDVFSRLDLSFTSAQEAYKSKTTWELIRAIVVYKLCSYEFIVNRNRELIRLARRLLGRRLFCRVMKGSFYGHFVAGEDQEMVKPLVERNLKFGVKSILDYSVEEDLSSEEATKQEMDSCVPAEGQAADITEGPESRFKPHKEFGDRRRGVVSARTYFYEDEAQCDYNMQTFMRSIDAVAGATNCTGFCAVKLTALGRPQFLLQMSEVLNQMKRFFKVMADGKGSGNGNSSIDYETFKQKLNDLGLKLSRDERKKWFTILDVTQDGEIDLLDWNNLLEVNMNLAKLLQLSDFGVQCLTPDEEQQMHNMLRRVDTLAQVHFFSITKK
ncbi:unnamed protein product [Owenia fusiformis]|uniref:Proline dehydrogenase n=1 Tax=Owenia fusiformis TaxID=6347 RepID=A0A8J1UWH9_OWEFU|nr:unnamed protein product [Owenia fusiformis]